MGLHGNRVYVRRPKGDDMAFLPDYIHQDNSKKQSGKVKFFGGFCLKGGVSKLYFYEKAMTGEKMIEIIKTNIIPETQRLFNIDIKKGKLTQWYILHDNDKRWKCIKVRDYAHQVGILELNDGIWPAYSPDLNPIENL
jgi:hypothetical protein